MMRRALDCRTVLAIETSCDETAVAIVKDGHEVLANKVASQLDLHDEYGGVVPELASRKHVETILPVLDEATQEAGLELSCIDLVAATQGPGLVGALLVGLTAGKALAFALDKPFLGVNHLEGHIYANFLGNSQPIEWPLVCLVASGGHADIIYMEDHGEFRLLGRTRDDAAGEAFDKVSRELGGRLDFPRAYLEEGSLDFSFSGLKTHAVRLIESRRAGDLEFSEADFCAGFQEAIVDVLVEKTMAAVDQTGVGQVLLAGGVAANWRLREQLERSAAARDVAFCVPPPRFCTDNAAMIGAAAYYGCRNGRSSGLDTDADPNLPLEREYGLHA